MNDQITSATFSNLETNSEFLIISTTEKIQFYQLIHSEMLIVLKGEIFEYNIIKIQCMNNFIITKDSSGYLNYYSLKVDKFNQICIIKKIELNKQSYNVYNNNNLKLFAFNNDYFMIDTKIDVISENIFSNSIMYMNSNLKLQILELNIFENEYVTSFTDFDEHSSSFFLGTSKGNLFRILWIYDDEDKTLNIECSDVIFKFNDQKIEKISKKNKTNYLIVLLKDSISILFFDDIISDQIKNSFEIETKFKINYYQEFFEIVNDSFILLVGSDESQIDFHKIDESVYKIMDLNIDSRFVEFEIENNANIK